MWGEERSFGVGKSSGVICGVCQWKRVGVLGANIEHQSPVFNGPEAVFFTRENK